MHKTFTYPSVVACLFCVSQTACSGAGIATSTPAVTGSVKPVSDDAVAKLVAKVIGSLRPLKAGTFEMGDWGNEQGIPYDMEPDSRPVHKVTLDAFSMMAYKVTYEDFDVFTDAVGKERIDMDNFGKKYRSPARPAGVSWYGAKAYCEWLGTLTKLPFDLPTEAQWEYAARAEGKKLLYATDNGKYEPGRNYPPKRGDGPKLPIPDVGSYPPNGAGIFGMSEPTVEWVDDWYGEKYYAESPEKNPGGPTIGDRKVHRGNLGSVDEAFSMTFMRGKAVPQPLHSVFQSDKKPFDASQVPLPGMSGYQSETFRCSVNAIYKPAR